VLDINESRYVIEPELNIGDYIGNTDIFVKRLSLLLSQFKGTKNENHGTNIERAKAGKSLNYYDDLSEDDLLENLQVTKNLTVYSAYTKLKIDDWYIITFLIPETHAIENDTNAIVFISLCVIALFILLTFLIYGSYVQVKLYKQIQNFVLQDSVTEGGNGDWFNVEAAKLIGISKTATRALVILDIDRFKIITDKFGHEQGNLTLRRIYDCICSILDPGEIVSRIEGDTFAMLMKYHKPETIRERMELLSMKINDPKQNKNKYVIYFSCGVCQITESNPDMMVLRDHALIGLYSCKNSQTGAVKVGFFNEVEHRKLLREKEIENRMGLALESKEFMVYLQPKYDIRQNRIAGAEALARWNDKDNGILMPSEFIPLFERNGFILSLDLFVFEQVCSTLRKWIDAGIEPVIISTNLSRTYLNDEAFLTKIDEIRERYDVPAKYIELEITESVVLENMNWLIEVINKIRARGFSCSLDDFGSGYSSLNVLKNLPIDVLKLDRKFFTNSENDPDRGNVIIASVIDLAKKLNIKTVSEGVEKTPQLEFLKDAQCDMVQSYIYSKPITISEFELIAYGKVIEKK
jgi:diguanylate cyclase (GGDEF)-like protein